MANGVFNIAKGAAAEKVRDDPTKVGILALKTVEADATLRDYDDIAAMLAAGGGATNVEANFTNYARIYPITATIIVNDTTDLVDLDMPDQTFVSPGGPGNTNNNLVKLVTYYQEGAADNQRIPLSYHDFVVTTDGNDILIQINAAGFIESA